MNKMTVGNVIAVVSAIEDIRVWVDDEVVFKGMCGDFRATCEQAASLVDREVVELSAVYNVLNIFV